MTLKCTRQHFVNLQDRCRAVIIKHVKFRQDLLALKLPTVIVNYLSEAFADYKPLRLVDNDGIFVP